MNCLTKIFTRSGMRSQIEATHDAIAESQIEYMLRVKAEGCLLDFMVSPVSRTLDITPKQHMNIRTALTEPKMPDFSRFGIYDLPEVGVMKSRWTFLYNMSKLERTGLMMNSKPKYQDISDISFLSDSPTTLLAIKYFALCRFEKSQYEGLPAMTTPARKACTFLFGNSFSNPSKAKTLHTQIATETGLTELEVNTALWVIGNNINK